MTPASHVRPLRAASADTQLKAIAALACGPICSLQPVIDALPAMLWVGDAGGARHWIGTAFSAFTGLAGSGRPGHEWLDALHPEDVERCCGIQLACGASARPFSLDYRLRTSAGHYRWVMDLAAPHATGRDLPFGYAGVCVDIHERRELEDQLAERTRKLRTSESAP